MACLCQDQSGTTQDICEESIFLSKKKNFLDGFPSSHRNVVGVTPHDIIMTVLLLSTRQIERDNDGPLSTFY